MFDRASYSAQVAAAFALLGLIVPFALAAVVGHRMSEDLRVRSGAEIAGMARQMAHQLDSELNDVRARTRLLAGSLQLDADLDPAAVRRALHDFQEVTPEIAWAGFARPDGVVAAATDGLLEGQSIRHRPVFREATDAVFLGGLHPAKLLDRHLGDPGIQEPLRFLDVSAPVRDQADGSLQGVVATHVSWAWAGHVRERLLSTTETRRGLAFAILGPEGDVLLGPTPPNPTDTGGLRIANVVQEVAAAPKDAGWELVDLAAREDIVASIQDSEIGLGWRVLAWQPADLAFAPANQAWRLTWSFALIAALLSGACGWLLGRRMGAPILRIAAAADGVREGRDKQLPTVNGPREVATLAGALGDLLDALQRESALQVSNAKLQRERSAAERASRAKSIFLANMNHELRTPLNAVMGFAQMMRHDTRAPLPNTHVDRIEQIERAGQHLLMVINDVLATAQAEAGELEIELQPMDLADVLRDALEMVRAQATGTAVALPDGPPEEPLPVVADPLRVRQILINLLSNAVKYNGQGGTVSLSIERNEGQLQLSVIDDGPGIDPARVDELFEPFNRGEATTAGREGIGLGLPLSRMLADRMNGSLTLANRPQGGAEARLSLPQAPTEEARRQTERPIPG